MRYLSLFLLFVSFIFAQNNGSVSYSESEKKWIKENHLVKIAVMNYWAHDKDKQSLHTSILKLLNKYGDLNLVPSRYDTWNEGFKKAADGDEIHGIMGIVKSKERDSDYFDFTQAYDFIPTYLIVRDDDNSITSLDDLKSKKVYLKENSITNTMFKEVYPDTSIIIKPSIESMYKKLSSSNEADAIVAQNINIDEVKKYSLKIVKTIYNKYGETTIAINHKYPQLYKIINKALKKIPPKELSFLRDKIWDSSRVQKLHLSKEQKKWLHGKNLIKIGIQRNWIPLSYEQNGVAKGLGVDYIDLLNKRLAGKLKIIPDSFKNNLEKVKSGSLDAMIDITPTKERKAFYAFTTPYITIPHAILTQKNTDLKIDGEKDLNDILLSVEKGFRTPLSIKQSALNARFKEYKNTVEAIEALSRGEVQAYVGNRAVANHILKNNFITNLKFASNVKRKGSVLAFGVSVDNKILRDILQVALDDISEDEINNIYKKYISADDFDKLKLTVKEKQWLKQHETITVSNENDWAPFNFIKNGKPSGFSIDYFNLLAKKIGIEPKYIQGYSWNQFLNMTKNKENDVVLNIRITPDRQKYLLFTDSYTDYITGFIVREDFKSNITSENIDSFKVAVVDGFSYHEELKRKYPNIKLVIKKNSLDTIKAVLFGEADIAPGSIGVMNYLQNANLIQGLKIIDGFNNNGSYNDNLKLYLGVRDDWSIFRDILNKAISSVSEKDIQKIRDKWFSIDRVNKVPNDENAMINISREQKNWLENHNNTVRMCIDPDWMPFEKIDKNGKHIGISSDYIKLFSKKVDFDFKLLATKSWSQSLEYIKANKCDILPAAVETEQRKSFLNFTKPYLIFPQVLITSKEVPFIDDFKNVITKSIGIKKGSAVSAILKKKYPKINIINVENKLEGLHKVSKGEIFGYIDTLPSAAYTIANKNMIDLKVAMKVGIDYKISVGVRKDSPQLIPLVNNLIESVNKEQKDVIYNRWISVQYEYGFDYGILWRVLAVVIIIFGVFTYWNRKLSAEIVHRKKIENELLESRKRLELALKGGDLGSWDIDFNSNKLIVNERWATMLGFELKDIEKITNQTWVDTIHPDDKQRVLDFGRKYKNGEVSIYAIEYRAIRSDDEVIWLLSKGSIVERGNLGEHLRMVGTVSDITSKKLYEEELTKAKDDAEAATQAKSMFLARMSHEIRTPMNAVLGMLYLTKKTSLTPIQDNYISKANNAAQSLLHVINDILDFSKIEAGKLSIESIEFDFNEMLSRIGSMMNFKAEEKGIELLIKYDPLIPKYLISDPARIEQILINLVGNAIKFTTRGEIIISPKFVKKVDDQISLEFCVKDSGIGISSEDQSKLFKDFSQVDESTTRRFGGSGLGLAISKKLSNLLGGKIWLESSSKSEGSVFCFSIKCQEAKIITKKPVIFPETLQKLKILIVDDNKVACEILSQMLDSLKLHSDIVSSGEEVLTSILKDKNSYDLIFMDYKMPGLNGVDTYRRIKEELGEKTPKTIMVTAYSKDEVIESFTKVGIESFLTKPVHPSLLFDTILHIMGKDKLIQKKGKYDDISNVSIENIRGSKILLVEDNEVNQEFAIMLLESNGMIVEVANDGLAAIEMIRSQKYDMVLMDIQMPNMDGLEATKHIRDMDDEYFKTVPIVALSAHAMSGDHEKSIDAGMNDHITKPIDPDKLFETMIKYIEIKSQYDKLNDNRSENLELFKELKSDLIDFQKGIQRAGGNQTGYMKILKRVSLKYKEFFSVIDKYIKSGDLVEAEAKAHELKGVSGNIGAVDLFKLTETVDNLLKEAKTPSYDLLESLKDMIQKTFEEIDKIEYVQESIEQKGFDNKIVLPLLEMIEENMEINIVESEDALEKVIPYLQDKKYKELISQVKENVENFDTDAALDILKNLKNLINKEINNG
ncbi:MAG: transporter substrate-binding domain-containing protein [Campylobacterota bacterium]|nr:transporter substrate-binding domain-containing protein [Campylobacterota bacterium]